MIEQCAMPPEVPPLIRSSIAIIIDIIVTSPRRPNSPPAVPSPFLGREIFDYPDNPITQDPAML